MPVISNPSGPELNARARRALREARTEAVVVLALDVALLAGLAWVDKAMGWDILELPWLVCLALAAPALVLIAFGLLFWQLDDGGPRLRAERG